MARQLGGIPAQSIDLASAFMSEYAVCLAVEFNGKVGPLATGFLVEIVDTLFLVTVRHAIERAFANHRKFPGMTGTIYVPSDHQCGTAVALPGEFQFVEEKNKTSFDLDRNLFDVAILAIPNDFRLHFSNHKIVRAYEMSELILRDDQFCGVHGIAVCHSEGWDVDDKQPDARLQPVSVFTAVVDYTGPTFDEQLHFAYRATLSEEIDGNPIPEKLAGLSGAPIWAFRGDPRNSSWRPECCELIGMQSAAMPEDNPARRVAIKGIRSTVILGMLARLFPDTGRHLDKLKPIMIQRKLPS